MDERHKGLTLKFRDTIPCHISQPRRDVRNNSVWFYEVDDVVGILNNAAELSLTLAQGFFGLLALGDIQKSGNCSSGATLFVKQWGSVAKQVEYCSIVTHNVNFRIPNLYTVSRCI